jgi:GAF domain-containing protein
MPPPPSSRHRELETLIPPVSQSEEDLIEPIVKRLTALRFIESREEAAAFLLEMALDVVPARVGLIHFFDPGPSEFVVAAAVGDRASALESWSTESHDPLLSDALRDKKLVHVTSTKKNPRVQKGRWAIIQPRNAVVCVPCHRASRRIGAFELVDPHGRTEFARNQLNALTFIAGEFSKFVSEHEPSTAKAAGS